MVVAAQPRGWKNIAIKLRSSPRFDGYSRLSRVFAVTLIGISFMGCRRNDSCIFLDNTVHVVRYKRNRRPTQQPARHLGTSIQPSFPLVKLTPDDERNGQCGSCFAFVSSSGFINARFQHRGKNSSDNKATVGHPKRRRWSKNGSING